MTTRARTTVSALAVLLTGGIGLAQTSYPIVDTGQIRCYDERTEIAFPEAGEAFFGQDAHYLGRQPGYRDNGDGTITDLNTGLMWQADPGEKRTYRQAVSGARRCRTGGYKDWRLPTIKEVYSLILFSGTDPDPRSRDTDEQTPFIDTEYFNFEYGEPDEGERVIDAQYVTSTRYVSTTMNGNATVFGVNFADGRIKGYPMRAPRGQGDKTFCVLYVRGNKDYGENDFVDNKDGTVTDRATGLIWMKVDSGVLEAGRNHDGKLNWEEALAWAEDLEYAGHDDWRLPSAKELQSIVDYRRAPDKTRSASINRVFEATSITNEAGRADFGYYWSSTTHTRLHSAGSAVYIAFGRALGYMSEPPSRSNQRSRPDSTSRQDSRSRPGSPQDSRDRDRQATLMDVHGAGAQRCDVKAGDPEDMQQGRGPQGDVMRIYNLVRCVRGGAVEPQTTGPAVEMEYQEDRPEEGERPEDGDRPERDGRPDDGERRQRGPGRDGPPPDRDDEGRPDGPPPRRGAPPDSDAGE
ncbi:MAG: DUF1566 domain-containing protein [Phycisphaerales bacterium JB038]